MLSITNREFNETIRTPDGAELPRSVSFDLDKNAPANSVFYCERLGDSDYREVGSANFLQKLKESDAKQLLIFIHGFSNLPEPDIFPRAEQLQRLFDAKEKNLVEIVPMIWPCDNDLGVVKDYWDDQKSADKSAYSFARVLQRFMDWREEQREGDSCIKRINVLAHSMGNRVFRETLRVWDRYDLANGVPMLFRSTILMAADIVNEALEDGQAGRLISHASRNVSVYFASDDLALRSSKISNLKNMVASRRLGHTGPEDMGKVLSNVYAIDCDNFNNRYDFSAGHSYFLNDDVGNSGMVFAHLFKTIKSGRVDVGPAANRSKIL